MKHARVIALSALLAVATGFEIAAAARPRPRVLGGRVALSDVTLEDDGKHYVVHARVTNTRTHGVYVYAMERGYDYDETTGTLTVAMHAVPHAPRPGIKVLDCHVMLPMMKRIGGGGSTYLAVKLPRTLRKTGPSGWSEVPFVPEHVRVDLAWSDAQITLDKSEQQLCTYDAEVRFEEKEQGRVSRTSR